MAIFNTMQQLNLYNAMSALVAILLRNSIQRIFNLPSGFEMPPCLVRNEWPFFRSLSCDLDSPVQMNMLLKNQLDHWRIYLEISRSLPWSNAIPTKPEMFH